MKRVPIYLLMTLAVCLVLVVVMHLATGGHWLGLVFCGICAFRLAMLASDADFERAAGREL